MSELCQHDFQCPSYAVVPAHSLLVCWSPPFFSCYFSTRSHSSFPGIIDARRHFSLKHLGPLSHIIFTLENVRHWWCINSRPWGFISYISELGTKGPATTRTQSGQIRYNWTGQLTQPYSHFASSEQHKPNSQTIKL